MKEFIYQFIAYSAAFCTTIAFLPQALMVWKIKDTSSISFTMYSVFTFGAALWLVYGILTIQIPLILANAITFILALSIWLMKLNNLKKDNLKSRKFKK